MPVPWGSEGFTKVKDIISRAQAHGCTVRTVSVPAMTSWGPKTIRYLYTPENEKYYDISDFDDEEYMAPSTIHAAERRLGISLDS